MRASGAPSALTVASVIAFGSGRPARTASSSQALKKRRGSVPACASERPERLYFCRSWATFTGMPILCKCRSRRGWIRTAERARRIFPLKIVDIGPPYRASSRHPRPVAATTHPVTPTNQRRNRDGEKEGEEERQEA